MTLNRSVLLGLALSCLPLSAAIGQWPSQISEGARIRVQLPEQQYQSDARRGHLLRGRVVRLGTDTLYLAVTDSLGPLAIQRSLIERVDISRGVPSRGSSALGRGLFSAASWALIGLVYGSIDDDVEAGDAALVGGTIGFGIGAIVGAIWPQERWKRVKPSF